MAYSNIRRYTKPHDSGNGSSKGGSTVYIGNSGIDTNNLYVTNLNATRVNADRIQANTSNITTGNFKYIVSEYGEIKKIEGDELEYGVGNIGNLSSSAIETKTLNVSDNAKIKSLTSNDIFSTSIVTDFLTVNKSAHFYELIIDKIRSIQGTQMNTAANCVADLVQAYTSTGQMTSPTANNVAYYRIYWKATDDEGRNISNDWLPLDQALCESFNVQQGTSYDVSNKYYWRKVIRTDNGTQRYVNFNTKSVSNSPVNDYEVTFTTLPRYTDGSTYFTDFNIESQISGEWDSSTNKWTIGTTQYGLQIKADEMILIGGTLNFVTNKKTKLNVGVYYDDDTFEYFQASDYATTYNIQTTIEKNVEAFVIISATIEKWEPCNWIDLSNTDMDSTVSGKYSIPSEGDNICQLGYRYTELANPTQDDINRASAIIIAAYATPDASVVPPSYAQYQNITDYNLSSHRKSYFDANGCTIIGNFMVDAAGTEIPLNEYIEQTAGSSNTEVLVQSNGANIDLCLLQVDSNNEIHDLNNFPQSIDLKVVNYSQATSINPQAATMNLFGRTIDLLNFTSDSSNGIYVSSVTTPGVDRIHITFGWRGTSQTIVGGQNVTFAGQVIVDGTTYNVSSTLAISAVVSSQGTDAELWKLYKDKEYAQIGSTGTYSRTLVYKLQHIVGTTATLITPTTEKLKISEYNSTGSYYMTTTLTSSDWANNCWTYNPADVANWYSLTDSTKPIYIKVELLDSNNNVLDDTVVNITLQPVSLFMVSNGLTQSIQGVASDVADVSTALASETANRTYQYSLIEQSVNSIGLHVNQLDSSLGALDSSLLSTGIDITNGLITLTAQNTLITGDLNLQGNFVSENATYMHKITADVNNGGFCVYSADSYDHYNPLYPATGATYAKLVELYSVMELDGNHREGALTIYGTGSRYETTLLSDSLTIYNSIVDKSTSFGLNGITSGDLEIDYSQIYNSACENRLNVSFMTYSPYNVGLDESLIIVTGDPGADFQIILPAPSTAMGKQVFLKNETSRNGSFTCVGSTSSHKLIMDQEDLDKDVSRDLQRDSTHLICDGTYWIIFSYQY